MALYSAFKVHSIFKVTAILAAVIVAMDPTVKVALIAGTALVLANIPTFVLQLLARKDAQQLKVGQAELHETVNGKLSQLIETKEKLSHAQGRREGVEATQHQAETGGA